MSQKSYDGTQNLYLVPTPIGNLDDITIRALNILKSVDVIFSEDTRETINLLNYFDIKKKVLSAHEHNEEIAKEKILSYLRKGSSVALVTDRGTPIISDPGFRCASHVIENGYNVVGLPGPTALIPALIVSGIEPLPFMFYGFTNSKRGKRKTELEKLNQYPFTIIFYESPHRIIDMLSDLLNVFGNRKIAVVREISKAFEEIYRGNIEDVIKEMLSVKGEIVVVVEGNKKIQEYDISPIEHVKVMIELGLSEKESIKKVAKMHNINKSDLYKNYHTGK